MNNPIGREPRQLPVRRSAAPPTADANHAAKSSGTASFSLRKFIVITAALSGLGLPFSGLENHLHQMEPITSVARHGWMAVHNLLALVFLASAIAHGILNRRALINYVRGGVARLRIGRETVAATTLVALVLLVAVRHAVH